MDIVAPILFFLLTQFTPTQMDFNNVQLTRLASEQMSLDKRYEVKSINDIFKDNILLDIAYLDGKVKNKEDINWNDIEKPFNYEFTLLPGQTFAFHDDILPQFKNTVVKTTNANFNFDDGFKYDGYLMGDGVCHLASLMYWVAKDAKLDAYAPTNHDFHEIPEISKEYGVAIYKIPGNENSNAMQNLYITNNKKNPIVFKFDYRNGELRLSIFEAAETGFISL